MGEQGHAGRTDWRRFTAVLVPALGVAALLTALVLTGAIPATPRSPSVVRACVALGLGCSR